MYVSPTPKKHNKRTFQATSLFHVDRCAVNSKSTRIAQQHTYQLGVLVFSFLLVDSLRCHPPSLTTKGKLNNRQNKQEKTNKNKGQLSPNTVLTTVTVVTNGTDTN